MLKCKYPNEKRKKRQNDYVRNIKIQTENEKNMDILCNTVGGIENTPIFRWKYQE